MKVDENGYIILDDSVTLVRPLGIIDQWVIERACFAFKENQTEWPLQYGKHYKLMEYINYMRYKEEADCWKHFNGDFK